MSEQSFKFQLCEGCNKPSETTICGQCAKHKYREDNQELKKRIKELEQQTSEIKKIVIPATKFEFVQQAERSDYHKLITNIGAVLGNNLPLEEKE